MNDRLRELMLEAGYAAPEQAGRAIKLADLVIQECMQHVQWVGKTNKNPVEPIHSAHAVKQRIKNKFGIDR